MTRHSKNCTASSVYSYNEKKKDAKASGYGSLKLLGKDGVKDFDCCSLSLHPCRNPVVTPDGHLFDKEAIFEYIISKKNEISQKIKEYEKQCKKDQRELAELGEAENRSRVENFLKTEAAVSSASQAAQGGPSTSAGKSGSSVSNMASGLDKKLPSFWIPSLTPGNKETKLQKPDKTVFCPISGKPLKIKDLIDVKFTLAVDPNDKGALDGKRERYKCPVTGDILRNNVPCAVLRPTGDVVTKECVEKLIKKDMLHPLTGAKLSEKDIIPLQRGGTGFTTANDQLMSKKARPVLQA
ncbi:LOW QUALITY PROTEIN: nitric oxide synthase-interacting protein homolog [Homarus americanus]|uniref:LOW QUALITY PROTEIN: nitric oxide synthase-interacting protein homolog n=1 Tax=Homarus americanus TaxID=6706 RepID=UPI001C46578A|nr:LOW QUALITY PROTEIN: nitric oxide synthase-interacting protein homolog [Homarus americanus]